MWCKLSAAFPLRIVFLTPLFCSCAISCERFSHRPDLIAAAFAQLSDKNGKDYYADAHPYLEQPLKQIADRIPELRTIQPTPNQEELPKILEETAKQVDEFFRNIVDVIAQEKITQEILTGKGAPIRGADVISRRSGENYRELGADYFDRIDVNRICRSLVRRSNVWATE
jgi:hypothetical protein